jgi:hypothetical protein
MIDGEPVEVLSIGSIEGGSTPANLPWRDALTELTRRVFTAQQGLEAPLNVNVVFQVPGNIVKPDFTGARTGSFAKEQRLLMVQVALPEEVPDDPAAYVRTATHEAIDKAARWAEKRRVDADPDALHAIVDDA